MSDYLFMLDNHLDAAQNRAVAVIQKTASDAGKNLWLTGGAMRDMLRGAPIRDLDFTVDQDALGIAAKLVADAEAKLIAEDPWQRGVELLMADGVRASVWNSRTENYSLQPGEKPRIAPATIHEDLRRRDFTINAIALSLNKGSKGLLIDPTNGQADLTNRELRTTNPYALLEDPIRIVRMLRFQHSMGFQLVPRTQSQFENALLDERQKTIPVAAITAEVRMAANAPNALQVIDAMAEAGLMQMISPAFTGEKLNTGGLGKLENLAQSVLAPDQTNYWTAFFAVLTEKLSTRERSDVIRAFGLSKAETDALKHIDEEVKGLEDALKSATVKRPSHVYDILQPAGINAVLLVLYRSTHKMVQERVRTYFSKYIFEAQEVTEEEVLATGAKPGTPKYDRTLKTLIAQRLNARPKKVEEEEMVEEAPAVVPAPMVRGARAR